MTATLMSPSLSIPVIYSASALTMSFSVGSPTIDTGLRPSADLIGTYEAKTRWIDIEDSPKEYLVPERSFKNSVGYYGS